MEDRMEFHVLNTVRYDEQMAATAGHIERWEYRSLHALFSL